MQLKIAKHSELLTLPAEVQQLLYQSHVVPVVDPFIELWDCTDPIIIFAGSYGSGKSFFVSDMLINRCITDNYFRCFYGRKVHDTIRGSIFPTIYEQIEMHNIKGFAYSKANTSSMIIDYKNGNKFIPFGADKIDKLKSIKEPSHFLLEELDQFTADDFGMCISRLGRTAKAKTQLIGMCNTDKVYKEHWLYPILFGDNPIGATIHWSNYRNNTMLPSVEEYEHNLRVRAMGDEDLYNAIANGTPGVRNKQNAWLYVNYKHCIIEEEIAVVPGNTIYLSFDFNNEPMTCTAWQFSSGRHTMNGEFNFINCVREFETSMADTNEELITLLCKKIKTAFPFHPLRITGDSSGRSRLKGVAGNKSIYFLLCKYLNTSEQMLDVPMANMPHTASRALCNTIMYNHKNIRISHINSPKLISDMYTARASEEKEDELVKDRKINKLDYFDTFRYIFATYFAYYLK